MSDCTRLVAIWATYTIENLKALIQQKHGNRPRVRVRNGYDTIPGPKWNSAFLKNEDKKELFAFISKELVRSDMNGRLLLTTYFKTVLSNKDIDLKTL